MAMTRLQRSTSSRTLVSLLQALENERTVVELRNDATLIGVVNHVDHVANVEMDRVTYRSRYGVERRYERMFVAGKHLRYVHIPDHVNIARVLSQRLDALVGVRRSQPEIRKRQQKLTEKLKRQTAFEKQTAKVQQLVAERKSASDEK